MEARSSLLFVSPCTPDPRGTGWEQRAYSFLLAYSRFMEVDLWFTPTADNPELARLSSLSPLCRSITSFYPSVVNDVRSGLKARLIDRLTSTDVVHVFRFQDFVLNIGHPCIVWDIDELPWPLRQPAGDAGGHRLPGETLQRLDAAFAKCVGKCRVVIGCSPLERPAGCARFVVVPNVVCHPASAAAAPTATEPRLLFVGNLNYPPNADALAFFSEQVLPILQGIEPDIRIEVVGRSPATDEARAPVARLQQDGRFRFSMDAADCAPFYARAALSLAPIRIGGGTRIKIIEAFAHRLAVVSTAKGCEGLNVRHGEHLLIADDPRGFAQACAELLNDAALRGRIVEAAYEMFEREHSQARVDVQLASTIGVLLRH